MTSIRFVLSSAFLMSSFLAKACGPGGNLVQNCSFDAGISGYTAQDGGDVVAHEPASGNLALGAMRVRDTNLDSDSDAEAESCVNLTSDRRYQVAASFRGVIADTCIIGWDEFEAPDCVQSNGFYDASPAIAVNNQSYSRLVTQKAVSELAQSVELVILCSTPAGEAEFLVDDVSVVPETVFLNGFESAVQR